jgi:FtsP/CotA-like multicopper oxidase with cupredoxin domain
MQDENLSSTTDRHAEDAGRHPSPDSGPDVKSRSYQKRREVEVELSVHYATHSFRVFRNGKEEFDQVRLRSYNGELVGPTVIARPGDTLIFRLKNQLPFKPELVSDHPHDRPHGFNVTNLHFHGLHVSPAGNSDNVLLEVGPNQEFEYEVKIPKDHNPGTFWYHAHKHGATGIQLGSGMAGALIIRGDIDEVPAIKCAEEKIFLLQQIPYKLVNDPYNEGQQANMVEEFPQLFEPEWPALVAQGRRVTLNGVTEPRIEMCPGEVQRWRFVHAGLHNPFKLRLLKQVDSGVGTEELPHYVIALDGITTGRLDREPVELHPGYRADVLVHAVGPDGNPLPPGTYLLVDEVEQHPQARILARVVVKGKPKRMALPSPAELAPLAPFKPVEDHELVGQDPMRTRFEVWNLDKTEGNPPFELRFMINGRQFNPHNPSTKLKLGKAQEWLIDSQGSPFFPGHPFHIHVNPFHYTDDKGRIIWKDTLFVPRGQQLRLRTRYERYIGTFVLHCHIVSHEDEGMMELLEIVPPRPDEGGAPPHDGSAVH